jgi:hypothetical protein
MVQNTKPKLKTQDWISNRPQSFIKPKFGLVAYAAPSTRALFDDISVSYAERVQANPIEMLGTASDLAPEQPHIQPGLYNQFMAASIHSRSTASVFASRICHDSQHTRYTNSDIRNPEDKADPFICKPLPQAHHISLRLMNLSQSPRYLNLQYRRCIELRIQGRPSCFTYQSRAHHSNIDQSQRRHLPKVPNQIARTRNPHRNNSGQISQIASGSKCISSG